MDFVCQSVFISFLVAGAQVESQMTMSDSPELTEDLIQQLCAACVNALQGIELISGTPGIPLYVPYFRAELLHADREPTEQIIEGDNTITIYDVTERDRLVFPELNRVLRVALTSNQYTNRYGFSTEALADPTAANRVISTGR